MQCLSVSCPSASVLSVLSGCLLYSVTCWFVGRSVGLSAHNIVLLLPGGLMIAKGYEMQLRWDH